MLASVMYQCPALIVCFSVDNENVNFYIHDPPTLTKLNKIRHEMREKVEGGALKRFQ